MALLISDIDPTRALSMHFVHRMRNRMLSVSGQAIHTGAYQEVGLRRLCGAKEFIKIAFAVADVDAVPRVLEGRCGLPQVLQPADAFFFLDRHPGWIDFLLERIATFELFRVQNFIAASPCESPPMVAAKLECIRMPQTT